MPVLTKKEYAKQKKATGGLDAPVAEVVPVEVERPKPEPVLTYWYFRPETVPGDDNSFKDKWEIDGKEFPIECDHKGIVKTKYKELADYLFSSGWKKIKIEGITMSENEKETENKKGQGEETKKPKAKKTEADQANDPKANDPAPPEPEKAKTKKWRFRIAGEQVSYKSEICSKVNFDKNGDPVKIKYEVVEGVVETESMELAELFGSQPQWSEI